MTYQKWQNQTSQNEGLS